MWTRIKNGDPIFLAAFAGSMFALVHTKNLTFWQKVQTSIGGIGAAVFLSPALASLWPASFAPAVSFLIGIFAMSVIGIAFQVIEQVKASPIKTIGAIANIVIDVLLAFRHGVDSHNRRKDDKANNTADQEDSNDGN
jgi:hypothetical protein